MTTTTSVDRPLALPVLPDSACAYEVYDPQTLVPANDSTFTRLMELGWRREDFEGRTVLDIGANTGVLAIHAIQLGAAQVHATDVQAPLVDFLSAVAERHGLPIDVRKRGLDDLVPSRDEADVVLLMEVLHWIVDQGGTVAGAIQHVASLTRETLYLETPWDIREPSIARKGVVTEAQYNMELILRELSRHFRDVQVVRFMTYFGPMKDSKRVLLRARGRRESSPPLASLGNANLVDIQMVHGLNRVDLVTTTKGPKVLKRLPPTSALALLDDAALEALCAYLAALRDPVLVAPERIGKTFRHRERNGRDSMLFPFVGRLGDYFPQRTGSQSVASPIELAIALRKDLRRAPAAVITSLRAISPRVTVPDVDSMSGRAAAALWTSSDIGPLWRGAAQRMADHDRQQEDAVVHFDLQSGNMLVDGSGCPRVVDLDLIRTGTVYSDLLSCAIFNGATPELLRQALARVHAGESRPVGQFDIDFSVAHALGWLKARVGLEPAMSQHQFDVFVAGLRAVAVLAGEPGTR